MMYPVLARVRYGRMAEFTAKPSVMTVSLVLNWVVGPVLMFALAWLLRWDPVAADVLMPLFGLSVLVLPYLDIHPRQQAANGRFQRQVF